MTGIAGVIGDTDTNTPGLMIEKFKYRGRKKREISGRNHALCVVFDDESALYEQDGIVCVTDGNPKLDDVQGAQAIANGMLSGRVAETRGTFAGFFADGETFYLVRDHFGVRPLYYAKSENDSISVLN
ncbi:MAG: hypothetical protein ACPL6C_02295 [bacterium]